MTILPLACPFCTVCIANGKSLKSKQSWITGLIWNFLFIYPDQKKYSHHILFLHKLSRV